MCGVSYTFYMFLLHTINLHDSDKDDRKWKKVHAYAGSLTTLTLCYCTAPTKTYFRVWYWTLLATMYSRPVMATGSVWCVIFRTGRHSGPVHKGLIPASTQDTCMIAPSKSLSQTVNTEWIQQAHIYESIRGSNWKRTQWNVVPVDFWKPLQHFWTEQWQTVGPRY